MDKDIKAALDLLDPRVDKHWTMDGLASTKEVSELAGFKVTRADIIRVAPSFLRSGVIPDEAPAADQAPPEEIALPGLSPEVLERAERNEKARERHTQLTGKLDELAVQIDDLERLRAGLRAELAAADADIEATRDTFATGRARVVLRSQQDAIARYERQKKVDAVLGGAGRVSNPIDPRTKGKRRQPTYPTNQPT